MTLNRFLLLLGMLPMIYACTETANQKEHTQTSIADSSRTETTPELPNSPTGKLIRALIEKQAKVRNKLTVASPSQANQLYQSFKQETDSVVSILQNQEASILDEYINFYDEKTQKIVLPDSVKRTQQALAKAELEFWEVGEGMAEIRTIPGYYLAIFGNYVTDDIREFLKINAVEDEKLYSADAGLVISFEELGKRVITWEQFIARFPQSQLLPEARERYKQYQFTYLIGMDNTPVVNSETGNVYPENKAELERFCNRYPQSPTTSLAKAVLSNQDSYEKLVAFITTAQEKL